MTHRMQSRARVPARGTPTIRRTGLPRRRMVGAGLAPALPVTPIRLAITFASRVLQCCGVAELCRSDLCCLFQSQRLDRSFAQDKLLYFAATRHGIGFYELEIARYLLTADLPFAILTQFFLCDLYAFSGQNHGQQFFAKEFVRYTEHLHIGNFGMADQEFFDFAWEEVLASANDHVFDAAHDIDIAVRIHRRQVAGV